MTPPAVTLDRLITSWETDLRARQMAPRTVSTYIYAARALARWCAERDVTAADEMTRTVLVEYLADLGTRRSPGGVSVAYRALQQFFKWADEVEEEITPNPMAKMRPPEVPDPETPVLREDQVKALWKVCEGKDFTARRDAAVVRLMLDTGLRLAETAGLMVETVSLRDREVYVMGKGRRGRVAPFGHATARALDRYERVRERHAAADLPAYWLAERRRGPFTGTGIYQMLKKRGAEAGIEDLHPHMLRHSWAHYAKDVLHDDEMMRLAGWKSRAMLSRYAASSADARARESAKRTALGDRL